MGGDKGSGESVLTQIYLELEFVVDDFEVLNDVRVPALLHDSNSFANLSLRFTDGLGEVGGRYWRLAYKPVQLALRGFVLFTIFIA